MSHTISFGPLAPSDHEPIARLLHRSLVHWYESRLRQGARFGSSPTPFRLFPEVYEALDPGEAITARDDASGEILGVCFTHERETHLSVGIVATAPEASGRGIAKQMMSLALEKARQRQKPARLVSSLLNLDSFSLYTRLGFVPGPIFQDLFIEIPASGLRAPAPREAARVREARPDEAAPLADLEHGLQGIRREKDFAFFLQNRVGAWQVLVLPDNQGAPRGFLVASVHPSCVMIGPGACVDESAAAALLWCTLDRLRGKSVVFLLPCAATSLVRTAYAWGARNVELHVAQSTAPGLAPQGICLPTFLPESA